MSISAMKQALQALETKGEHHPRVYEAITALRQAIAEAEKQEPVAWWDGKESVVFTHDTIYTPNWTDYWTKPLYEDPTPCKTCEALAMSVMADHVYHEQVYQQREWVGLTEEEQKQVRSSCSYSQFMTAFEYADAVQKATEAKLKEKNT